MIENRGEVLQEPRKGLLLFTGEPMHGSLRKVELFQLLFRF
jgi:hypothetical protein